MMENSQVDVTANQRERKMVFSQQDFARMVINDLSGTSSGRNFLKKFKQSEVREIIETYTTEKSQKQLREISQLLWAKSPQYQRLIKYFAGMANFAHVITPVRELKKLNNTKVVKQYVEIGELVKTMSLRHEMTKVMNVVFREDIFYGYIHIDKKSFYIQQMPSAICKATAVEDGVLNFSIDMHYFQSNEKRLDGWANEIKVKFRKWKSMKNQNPQLSGWVELDAANTICIKANEDMVEVFPPFAGSFDSIFDIDGFKQLRKDKEELGNYMVLTQKLPIRSDSGDNNDFMIDNEFMMYFHNQAVSSVPDNVGVITSPMEIEQVRFDADKADKDGVGKATRDFWAGSGTSQLIFSSDNNSSAGLMMSIRSDEEMVFMVLSQIERWLNRYLKIKFSDLYFNISILPVTRYNQSDMYKMYLDGGTLGVPVKSHLSATLGLDPIEVMNMSFLENDILKMHEEWIPLQSSYTMSSGGNPNGSDGAPKKEAKDISDEGDKSRDKDSSVKV